MPVHFICVSIKSTLKEQCFHFFSLVWNGASVSLSNGEMRNRK